MRAAESIAPVLAEEGADSTGPRICDAKLSSPRKNYRIGDHYEMPIDASLEIAQQMIPARDMVAEMAEGLHDLPPPLRPVAPARGAIELLVVLDKGLAEEHLAGPLPSEVTFLHLSHIDLDGLIDDV